MDMSVGKDDRRVTVPVDIDITGCSPDTDYHRRSLDIERLISIERFCDVEEQGTLCECHLDLLSRFGEFRAAVRLKRDYLVVVEGYGGKSVFARRERITASESHIARRLLCTA